MELLLFIAASLRIGVPYTLAALGACPFDTGNMRWSTRNVRA